MLRVNEARLGKNLVYDTVFSWLVFLISFSPRDSICVDHLRLAALDFNLLAVGEYENGWSAGFEPR